MGIFGFQLVATMIVASFLHKLSPYYSIGRWMCTVWMKRYLPPTDDKLRPYVALPSNSSNSRTKRKQASSSQPSASLSVPPRLDKNLAVPKSAHIRLDDARIKDADLIFIHFGSELKWMFDFTFAAVMVFASTFTYYYIFPSTRGVEFDLSSVWLAVVCYYTIALLTRLSKVYFSAELPGERSVGVVFTMMFFVCALGILLIDEGYLDFGLEKSHRDISRSIGKLLEAYVGNPDEFQVVPMWLFKMLLAVCATALSAVLIFPGFRFAETHFDSLRFTRNLLLKMLLHLNYTLPMLCLAMWVTPISRAVVAPTNTVQVAGIDMSYDDFRICSVVFACVLRVVLFKKYLQSYLNVAKYRVEHIRKELGRITIAELRNKVSSIFKFYCGIGVQYVAPVLLLLSLALLLCIASYPEPETVSEGERGANLLRVSGLGVRTVKGCLSFLCWWVLFTLCITSGFGSVLREYLYA